MLSRCVLALQRSLIILVGLTMTWYRCSPQCVKENIFTKFLISQIFQDGEIDASKYVQSSEEIDLAKRTFKTRQFFDDNKVTPAGLSFFQSDWDSTLTKFFHHTLNMREPRYEYDFPPYYTKPWVEKNPRQ